MKVKLPLSIFLLVLMNLPQTAFEQNKNSETLEGAWTANDPIGQVILLFKDGYMTKTTFNKNSGKFIQSFGGPFKTGKGEIIIY